MNITVISTSPRKGSNTLKLSKALTKLFVQSGHEVKLYDFENYDIPMVGQGSLDPANLSEFQKGLVEAWSSAELVVFAAPEYNWTTSGQLINAVHQLGSPNFAHLFNDKVFAFAGVSAGRGGRLPAVELSMLFNKMINFLNQYSVVSPRLLESHETGKNLGNEGESQGNEAYDKACAAFVDYSLKIAERWFGK